MYTVGLAQSAADLRAAQRLRYQVFADEFGARLDSPVSGHDVDRFDAYCDHLLVRSEGEVVGTYRLLPPGRSDLLYSETEFDLSPLKAIRRSMVETGRSCVHPGHRTGTVIGLMWAGIARYMVDGGHSWLVGCCSVPVEDAGDVADRVPLGPEEYRVKPLLPWSDLGQERRSDFRLPPLLRGYLRLGAWVCGPPALDPAFNTADFLVLLPMSRVNDRYLRHFLGER
ncbi:GNAT family N-acetyltransferase [Nonomuraea sp. NPDC050663]|uniref:GNAT family N-acetyltransferase n=1 Tax=Nonomuraea sp. NPDC050663 TaxID=3364370 RepID=UPI0037B65361